jgi:hypothetical protein
VKERVHSEKAHQLLALLRQASDDGTYKPGPFFERAAPVLFPDAPTTSWEETDLALNEMARAFLLPPTPQLLRAAWTDFATARQFPVPSISDHLFEMTTYYFGHESEMKECEGLVTFRDYDAANLTRLSSDLRYFHLWGPFNYNWALIGWLMLLACTAAVARWMNANPVGVIAFAVILAAIGTLMVAVTCLLGESLPRYTLPMWQLLLLSSFLLLGRLLDHAMGGKVRRAAVRSEP